MTFYQLTQYQSSDSFGLGPDIALKTHQCAKTCAVTPACQFKGQPVQPPKADAKDKTAFALSPPQLAQSFKTLGV